MRKIAANLHSSVAYSLFCSGGKQSMASAAAASSSSPDEGLEEVTLTVRWSGKEYTVRVCGDDSVGELKRRICEATNVLPKRQKLLYPKLGPKLSDDSLLLSQLNLKSSLKMTMIGFVTFSISDETHFLFLALIRYWLRLEVQYNLFRLQWLMLISVLSCDWKKKKIVKLVMGKDCALSLVSCS